MVLFIFSLLVLCVVPIRICAGGTKYFLFCLFFPEAHTDHPEMAVNGIDLYGMGR